jgi:DNA-binding transcriptional ArsR family regulator
VVEYPSTVTSTLDDTYGALAHQVRRALLIRLRDGSARVTELAEPFDLSLEAVSKHLRVLERAGLVRRTVRAREHWLELEPEPLREAAGWIETYRAFWETRLDALESMLRTEGGKRRPS